MRNLNRVSLSGLRAIEAVGRLGGLGPAAEELGVTPGAVSQQVQKTEAQLGCRLFERRPKGMVATPRGEVVIAHLTGGLSELSAAVALAVRRREDILTVSVPPVFAAKWLVWRLNRFYEKYPEMRVHVDATPELVDPDRSDVDICIRVGEGGWANVEARKLMDHWVFPVCSPALAQRIAAPVDLAGVPIIRDRDSMFAWTAWLGPQGFDEAFLPDGPVYSDASLCLDAAIAGQGVFLAWDTLADHALASGRLVTPFPDRHRSGFAYWFVTGRRAARSRAIRDFEAWLRHELPGSQAGG